MKETFLMDDIVNAIVDTVNDSNCEDDAKNVIKTIIRMYVMIKYLDIKNEEI